MRAIMNTFALLGLPKFEIHVVLQESVQIMKIKKHPKQFELPLTRKNKKKKKRKPFLVIKQQQKRAKACGGESLCKLIVFVNAYLLCFFFQALGKEGVILEVDSDGDAVVMVGANLWLFNPEALQDLTDGEAAARRNDTPAGSSGKMGVKAGSH